MALMIVLIVTFVIIVGIGVWSGTKIKSANQWSGGDKTMGPLTLGCVFAAWQIGGMAVEIAGKVVEREINEADHQALIDEFIRNVGDAS